MRARAGRSPSDVILQSSRCSRRPASGWPNWPAYGTTPATRGAATSTGIRFSELAGICCHPGDPARTDLDLHAREIRIRGKGGTARIVKIGHQAARSLDRYLRARDRHPQAWRPQLWLGVNGRGPMTAGGIYQAVARRGRQCGVTVYPHRFRHHFSHTWIDRGGAERDLMELNGWTSPQMLTRYGASARGARARRSYDRIMDDTT
jgi:integrase/recombinase XerD